MQRALVFTIALLLFPISSTYGATNPYGSTTIDPAGPSEIILTVSSPAVVKKYRLADLYLLAQSKMTINEPFVKKVQTFSVSTKCGSPHMKTLKQKRLTIMSIPMLPPPF